MELRTGTKTAICVAVVLAGVVRPFAARETVRDGVRAEPTVEQTEAYLRTLDVVRFVRQGTDFSSPLFDRRRVAEQFGRRADDLVNNRDYDFERLEEIERRLEGADRERVVAVIFKQVDRKRQLQYR